MKLIIIMITFYSVNLLAGPSCNGSSMAKQFIQMKNNLKGADTTKGMIKLANKEGGEVIVDQGFNIEGARNFALNHPIAKDFNFGKLTGPNTKFTPYTSTMNSSSFKGKIVGYQSKLPNGDFMRYRYDWDKVKGGHINVELRVPAEGGGKKNVDFAVNFNCGGKKCTEKAMLKFIEKHFGHL